MKLQLTTWQRIVLFQMVADVRGPAGMMQKAIRVMEALEMTEEDESTVGLRRNEQGWPTWDDVDHRFEIEIKDREAGALVKRLVSEKQDWRGADARSVIDLAEQLGVLEDESL